ncbi:helix-turn-helix transcriptional regulator [Halogeometricum borinquense]|uniref:Helix-turn-helix transcriptional regulator n=1 Tax=Halogeometricum borinquense TaxID=60847 RepID=A0A6C0UJE8_9EURY|nr:helix-turn-helix domain-containing protein [Halogeometricum borinquense]QIB74421.1 helix-turn-helix transcriptional regulator [Halogeometricum borinquense]
MGIENVRRTTTPKSDERENRTLQYGSVTLQRKLNELAELIGRKWNLVIVAKLLHGGPMGFSELEAEIDGISNKVLAVSLQTLEDYDVVDREIVSERPFRVEYSLTQQGLAFESIIRRVREGDFQVTPPED